MAKIGLTFVNKAEKIARDFKGNAPDIGVFRV
jgi:hypothetical protein